ncbi:MAG TPA: hypothetical protein VFC39_05235 [Acidobacteriaceae bacterium]|nr:hypothetical protein [Acidobacteriaceae bacterium]
MNEMTCYRIRMKFGKDGPDISKEAWEAGLVGIWFGSWGIQDLYHSYAAYPSKQPGEVTNGEIESYINAQLRLRHLPLNMKADFVPAIKTFDETLSENSWICTYFDGKLHLGQIADKEPRDEARFDLNKERFKARTIKNCKSFEVATLPDAFRLIASAGRQTIHKLDSHRKLVSILINAKNVDAVISKIRTLPFDEWMDILGDKGWESVCTAYLIMEHGFLPTGLLVGRTLPDFDIVGHDLSGIPIYGQCKKNPGLYSFNERDRQNFAHLPKKAKKFFFPFAGGDESAIPGVSVISYPTLRGWLDTTTKGKKYKEILRLGG